MKRDQPGDHPTKRLVVTGCMLVNNRRPDYMLRVTFTRNHNTPATAIGPRIDHLRAVLLNEKPSQKSCMLNQMLPGTGRKQRLSNSVFLLALPWMNHFTLVFIVQINTSTLTFLAEKQHVATFPDFLPFS